MFKKYNFTRKNKRGLTETIVLAWKGIDCSYPEGGFVKFQAFDDLADFDLNFPRNNPKEEFYMPVSPEKFLEFIMETTKKGDIKGAIISDKSWELALSTAFVQDYDDNGEGSLKSLTELSATEIL